MASTIVAVPAGHKTAMSDQTTAVSTVADDTLRTALAEVEKQYDFKKWREIYDKGRYVDAKQTRKHPKFRYTLVPASEEASERLHVPAGVTSGGDGPETILKKAREETSGRFKLGAAINDRKGPAERALDCFALKDFGLMDGQIMPPSFKTSMLDEERGEFDSTLSDSVLARPPLTLTAADYLVPTNQQIRVNTADIHKILLALGRGPELEAHWAWQRWKAAELARNKTEEQFGWLAKRFQSEAIPTQEEILRQDIHHVRPLRVGLSIVRLFEAVGFQDYAVLSAATMNTLLKEDPRSPIIKPTEFLDTIRTYNKGSQAALTDKNYRKWRRDYATCKSDVTPH